MAKRLKPSKAGPPVPASVADASWDPVGHFEVYAEYGKTLRVWLVSYGIGAPVLFTTSDTFAEKVLTSGASGTIATVFLLGVGGQVTLALLNKNAMWACYYAAENAEFKRALLFRVADWFSRQYWIDVVLDLGTFALFGWATWKAVVVATGTT
jgi:hypothetical protein